MGKYPLDARIPCLEHEDGHTERLRRPFAIELETSTKSCKDASARDIVKTIISYQASRYDAGLPCKTRVMTFCGSIGTANEVSALMNRCVQDPSTEVHRRPKTIEPLHLPLSALHSAIFGQGKKLGARLRTLALVRTKKPRR